jgi:hypothetical protein
MNIDTQRSAVRNIISNAYCAFFGEIYSKTSSFFQIQFRARRFGNTVDDGVVLGSEQLHYTYSFIVIIVAAFLRPSYSVTGFHETQGL